jgi:tripartite ATP-independent transporter DctM subunit
MAFELLVFLGFIVLVLLNMPIALVLGVISSLWILIGNERLLMIPLKLFSGIDNFVLMAIPFFVLAGEIMNKAGITKRLIDFTNILFGRLRGGLAQVNIYASLLFAGITGAALSDVSALGSIFIPAMEKEGYTRPFSAAVTAASSIIGPIIPPSIIIVIYGAITGNSIGALFTAAIIPGVLIALTLSLYIAVIGKKRNFPKHSIKITPKVFLSTFKDASFALIMPLIILVGILGGVTTPTEAAAIAVGYALIIGVFVYRKIKLKDMFELLGTTVRTSAMLFLIISMAAILGWILAKEGLAIKLADGLSVFSDNITIIYMLIVALLLFIGTWLEAGAICIILGPILTPMMASFGVHPIHFGIVMIVTINIGLITPPLGVCLFAASAVSGSKFEAIVREIWPFIAIEIIVVILMIVFPQTTLLLPKLFGFI